MKKVLLATLLAPSLAFAAEGYYGRIDAGISNPKTSHQIKIAGINTNFKMKKAPVFSLGLGQQINENLRAELNVQYRKFQDNAKTLSGVKSHYNNIAGFVNVALDMPTTTVFTPYLTAGAGISHVKAKGTVTLLGKSAEIKKNHNKFAWNIGAGSKIKLQDNVNFDLGYKWVDLGKIRANVVGADKSVSYKTLHTHELTAGLIFNF